MDVEDNEKNLVATLYLNRAASLHVSLKFRTIVVSSLLLSGTLDYRFVIVHGYASSSY